MKTEDEDDDQQEEEEKEYDDDDDVKKKLFAFIFTIRSKFIWYYIMCRLEYSGAIKIT